MQYKIQVGTYKFESEAIGVNPRMVYLNTFNLPREIKPTLTKQMLQIATDNGFTPLPDVAIEGTYLWAVQELLERMITDGYEKEFSIFWSGDLGGYKEVSGQQLEELQPYMTIVKILEDRNDY